MNARKSSRARGLDEQALCREMAGIQSRKALIGRALRERDYFRLGEKAVQRNNNERRCVDQCWRRVNRWQRILRELQVDTGAILHQRRRARRIALASMIARLRLYRGV
ncbi:MAG: hypothetical protein AB7F76_01600 [Parvibaculaceae bacterium]